MEPSGLVLEESRGSWQREDRAAGAAGVCSLQQIKQGLGRMQMSQLYSRDGGFENLGIFSPTFWENCLDSSLQLGGTRAIWSRAPCPALLGVYPAGFGISSFAGPRRRAVFPKVRLARWVLRR